MRDSLELLEWPVLFEHLLNECLTPYGVQQWRSATFLPDAATVSDHQNLIEGFKTLLIRYGDVTTETGMPDINSPVNRLAKGGYLNLVELRQIMKTLTLGGGMIRHFSRCLRSEPAWTKLESLVDDTLIPAEVQLYLEHFVDADGEIKDNASPVLLGLRQKHRHQKQLLQQRIQSILHNPDYAQALQSNAITERDGRSVFPVKVEHKSKMPGVIHGASSSGSTIFVEPQGLVEINNTLQGVLADLQKEIDRILKEVSVHLHEHWEVLKTFIDALGILDRHLAGARFSRVVDGNPVTITDTQLIDIRKARHPLLAIRNRRQPELPPVVANDLTLGTDGIRTLIITGPNTGGKTVLLKTIGLFAVMLKAGLHLPVAENSRMALFEDVHVDIGDQQSLAQSLSTFSAHLYRLKEFVADETDLRRGLVLIDEIAAGTDPAEGSALAKAVLDELYIKGAISIVSTHLGELKLEAHQHHGFMNASVEFNVETLSPTYRLMLGVPGASNAITIAQRLGLKPSVISRAKAAMSAPVRESAELLQEFETRNRQLEEELQSARSYRIEAQEAYEKLEMARQQLETDKRQQLKQFQMSLKGRIHDLESQVKNIRKDIQKEEPDLDQLNFQIRKAGSKADRIFHETRDRIVEAPRLTVADLKIGETVFSRQLEISGEIVSINKDSGDIILQAGILRVTVPVGDLQKPFKAKQGKSNQPRNKVLDARRPSLKINEGASVLEEPRDPSLSCDVRGQRADEAIHNVEQFLDEATMLGYQAVAIIHGLGTGALKREIRQYLSGSGYVRKHYPAQATQGGDGKTIIELKG